MQNYTATKPTAVTAHRVLQELRPYLAFLEPQQAQPILGDGIAQVHFARVDAALQAKRPITFILPAFPAKSPNHEKTLGSLPDYGEFLALKMLQDMCSRIATYYVPGAEVVICSDGRVFSDLVKVSDVNVGSYNARLKEIISEAGFDALRTFDLDDVFVGSDFATMRLQLAEDFAEPLADLQDRVRTSEADRAMFNGIHRFVFEDYSVLLNNTSRNKTRLLAKKVAYEVIRRSNAWSRLLAGEFPEAVRLSIHPQYFYGEKLGIKLVQSDNIWSTPWHRVALFDGYQFRLVKNDFAKQSGAHLRRASNGLSYYSLA